MLQIIPGNAKVNLVMIVNFHSWSMASIATNVKKLEVM